MPEGLHLGVIFYSHTRCGNLCLGKTVALKFLDSHPRESIKTNNGLYPKCPNLGKGPQRFHPARRGLLIRPAMSTNGRFLADLWHGQSGMLLPSQREVRRPSGSARTRSRHCCACLTQSWCCRCSWGSIPGACCLSVTEPRGLGQSASSVEASPWGGNSIAPMSQRLAPTPRISTRRCPR